MADDMDRAQAREGELRDAAIAAARQRATAMRGPRDCLKCEGDNDRCEEGFAVCSDCMGGAGE